MDDCDWTTRIPTPGTIIKADGLTIQCHAQAGATLISGDLDRAIAALAPGAQILGLLGTLPKPPYALRIARDRALLCTNAPLPVEGWQSGYAVSAAEDLFLEITIRGPRASEVAAACLTSQTASPSAAVLFAGFGALVTRIQNGLSIRVPPPESAALWAHLHRLTQVL